MIDFPLNELFCHNFLEKSGRIEIVDEGEGVGWSSGLKELGFVSGRIP